VALRVLTWNLMHGRAMPGAGHDLLDEFTAALGGWEWDVALLQEVPPWWPSALGSALGAQARLVLTSRNFGLPVRRVLATRCPDLIKSNGGGANAILVRHGSIGEHRTQRLTWRPERRWLHAVRLPTGVWVGNLHATVRDAPAAVREAHQAAATIRAWAAGAPLVLGGDFNVRRLSLDGFVCAANHDVDYVFVRGLPAVGGATVPERGRLSDHAPVGVTLAADLREDEPHGRGPIPGRGSRADRTRGA
jgi:endonuclease/exonuclease/phosphatase family metal-dependent hydrolase